MKKRLVELLAVLFVLGIFAVPAALAAGENEKPAKVTKWLFQPCFDSSDAGWANGIVPWIKAVEEATEGTIKIELQPAGAITSGAEAFGVPEHLQTQSPFNTRYRFRILKMSATPLWAFCYALSLNLIRCITC